MADPKIRIRRSATPNKVPTTTQLQLGELAINTYDGRVYLEQDQGGVGVGTTVIAVNPWGVGIGSTAYNTQFTAGKVGIATTNPQYSLDVGGDINFSGDLYQDGSAFTSGVGIRTAGGTVGWAATIIDFRGPGVTTAYYSSSTGIGTVYFQGGGGSGGGNASVTVSDSAPSSPSNGDLWFKSDVGELYLWYTDGSSNQWVEASGGSNTVITSDTAPSSPQDGDLWWNSNTGELKVYYNDGNSSQWVDANSEGGFLQYWTETNTNGTLGVTTTGYVGIGTTTATDALTVVGAADIDGNLIVSGVSTFSSEINLPDNIKASFGTGDDGSIKHTGSNLQIQETTGNIQITNYANDKDVVINSDDGSGGTANYFLADGSTGEALLYHYGTEKIKTTSTGASVTGDLAASGNVTGVAATFTGNVTVEGVLTYEDVKNVDAIGIVTARKGIKALAGGANIVDGTTTDNLNVTGITTFAGITTSTGTIFGKQLNISGISTLKNTVVGGATTELIVHGDARVTGVLSVGQGSLSINERDIYAVGVFTGANFKTGTSNLHSAGVEVAGVNVLGADTPVGLGATVYNSGLIVGKQGAEFQGVVTASSFHGSGADLTDVISGVGIGTAGGVVGYAATIIHFKGAGVTTAYYSSATGIGTINFHSAGGGGGNANVTISDTPPGSPSAGDLWWESDIGELKIYYSDGDSSQWVDAAGADSLVQIGTSAPTGAVSGDLWFNSETGDFMVYYTDANSSAWVSVNAVNSNTKWLANSTGIHTSSYVGIGTTTVTDALTVVGATDLDGTLLVSGITTFGTHVYHGDNDNAIFGDGSDLSIWHNGTNSHIRNTQGDFVIDNSGGGGLFLRAKQNENSIYAVPDAQVQIYHNNVKKFETMDSGVNVSGITSSTNLNVTGIATIAQASPTTLNVAGVTTFKGDVLWDNSTNAGKDIFWDESDNSLIFSENVNIKMQDSSGGQNVSISNGGSGLSIGAFSGGTVKIAASGGTWIRNQAGEFNIKCNSNASTDLYYANVKTFETVSGGAKVTGNLEVTGNTNILGTLTYEDVKNVDSVGIATARQGLRITGGGLDVVGVSTFNDNVKLLDSDTLSLGTGSDLTLSHDGSNSTILNTTGELIVRDDSRVRIRTDQLVINSGDNSESIIYAEKNGAVQLYHNNVKKFETTSSGISVTGSVIASSTVKVGDSVEFIAGDGNDLRLWHNATDSYIKNYTGDLWIQGDGDDIHMRAADDINIYTQTSDKAIVCVGDGAVELYHDNNKKIETTSSGISVTGQGVFSAAITASTYIQGTSSNGGLKFYSDSSASKGVTLNTDDHLVPSHDSNSDLGLTGTRWRNVYADTLYGDGSNLTGITGTTINNNADNRIITGSGTANTLEGEANLTFDGVALTFANVTAPSAAGSSKIYATTEGGANNGTLALVGQDKISFIEGGFSRWYLDNGAFVTHGTTYNNLGASSTSGGRVGNVYVQTSVDLKDDAELRLGDSDDLKIFHDGTDSFIHGTTGTRQLKIRGQEVRVVNEANTEIQAKFVENGSVSLYYDNNTRLSTESFGVQIDMTPRMDLVGTGNNIELKFITNTSTHRGSVYADNGNTIGFLKAGTGSWAARWHSDGKQTSHGAIWPNASNTYNLGSGSYRWNEAYIKKISLNTSSTNSQFTLNGGSSANVMSIRNTTLGNGNVGILFSTQDHSGGREKAAIYHQETHGTAHYGGDFIFCLANSTGGAAQVAPSDERMRITRGGEFSLSGDTDTNLSRTGTNEWTVKTNGTVCTKFRANQRVHMPTVWSTNGSSGRDVEIESDGNLFAGNTSLRAAKKNIVSQTDVSWLYDLNPVTFNYRKKIVDEITGAHTYLEEIEEEISYGLIAEEVEVVKKDFCFYNKDEDGNDELSGVSYKQLITPLLKALQDQKKEIDTLKAEVAALKSS